MNRREIVFATGNSDKALEAKAILPVPVRVVNVEVDEVQPKDPKGLDLEYIAKKKVEAAYAIVQEPVFVDDVSLEIEAWYGRPGPLVKFFQHPSNRELLELIRDKENRS